MEGDLFSAKWSLGAVIPLVGGVSKHVKKVVSGVSNVSNTIKYADQYAGVKQASQYLKDIGMPRNVRKQVLESFDVRTIKMDVAGDSTYGIRFYGGNAKASGPHMFETFGPTINRQNLALPNEWNTMKGIQQWQIKPGTLIIKGNAAPQLTFGEQFVGGANQMWIPNPWDNIIRP